MARCRFDTPGTILPNNPSVLGTWLKPSGEKEPCEGFLDSCSFSHSSGATAKAMSRPEQEETGEVFEEAHKGLSEASESMAGGPLPTASAADDPVPFSRLFGPGGMQQCLLSVGCSRCFFLCVFWGCGSNYVLCRRMSAPSRLEALGLTCLVKGRLPGQRPLGRFRLFFAPPTSDLRRRLPGCSEKLAHRVIKLLPCS